MTMQAASVPKPTTLAWRTRHGMVERITYHNAATGYTVARLAPEHPDATAWCPTGLTASAICPPAGTPRRWLGSAGAELQLDAAVQYDFPFRFRVGVAAPVA